MLPWALVGEIRDLRADFGIGRVRNRSVGHNPRGDALSAHAVFLINGHFSFVFEHSDCSACGRFVRPLLGRS